MTKPTIFRAFPRNKHPGYGPYPMVVDEVHDGDTVWVFSDQGFGDVAYEALRIKDLWTPELHEELGPEAKADLEKLLPKGAFIVGKTYPSRDFNEIKTFTRYVASLTLMDGRDVALTMHTLYGWPDVRIPTREFP